MFESISPILLPSNKSIFENTPKGSHIESPAIRYFYYVIANISPARGEYTRVNEDDKLILAKAAIPNCNVMPNLETILIFHLECQAN